MKIKGHITAGVKETQVTYSCMKCGQEKTLVFRPNISDLTKKLYYEGVQEKLCMSCLIGTDSKIEGAAENLAGLLC